MLPRHSFQLRVRKPIIGGGGGGGGAKRQFSGFLTLISQSRYKNTGDTYQTAYGWYMIGI